VLAAVAVLVAMNGMQAKATMTKAAPRRSRRDRVLKEVAVTAKEYRLRFDGLLWWRSLCRNGRSIHLPCA
jgi:hypothetical protein